MTKKIPIVDENDQVVGYKFKEDLLPGDIFRVTALWVQNSKSQVLIAKRSPLKPIDPLKWGPAVAGTVEEGENYRDNIIQEAKEEIGLTNIDPQADIKFRLYKPNNTSYFCQWFTANIDKPVEDFILQKDEVVQVRWISCSELVAEIKENPDNYVTALKDWLKNKGKLKMEEKVKNLTLCIIHKHPRIILGLKKKGFGVGKWNGFGGKVEDNESVEEATLRELKEELGVKALDLTKIGMAKLHYAGKEPMDMHIFKVTDFVGEPIESDEMIPQWFHIDEIPFSKMWESDVFWFPYFIKNKPFQAQFYFDSDYKLYKPIFKEL